MKKIKVAIKSLGIAGKINEMDGVRIDEADGWFLIRPSGTENLIRLTIEYKTEAKLRQRVEQLREIIKRNL